MRKGKNKGRNVLGIPVDEVGSTGSIYRFAVAQSQLSPFIVTNFSTLALIRDKQPLSFAYKSLGKEVEIDGEKCYLVERVSDPQILSSLERGLRMHVAGKVFDQLSADQRLKRRDISVVDPSSVFVKSGNSLITRISYNLGWNDGIEDSVRPGGAPENAGGPAPLYNIIYDKKGRR